MFCVGANKFISKKTNKDMLMLHCTNEMRLREDGSNLGKSAEVLFVSLDNSYEILGIKKEDVKLSLYVNQEINVNYNRGGFVDCITLI